MRLDSIVRDTVKTLRSILEAFSNNITASDNLSSEGGRKGQVLVNQGPGNPPIWMDKQDVPDTSG